MFFLLICIFFAYRNGLLAKQKGQNTVVWVIISIVAFFIAYIAGTLLMVALFYRGPIDPSARQALESFLTGNPIRVLSLMMSGIGGYLLIHYILSRMPDVPNSGNDGME